MDIEERKYSVFDESMLSIMQIVDELNVYKAHGFNVYVKEYGIYYHGPFSYCYFENGFLRFVYQAHEVYVDAKRLVKIVIESNTPTIHLTKKEK